VRVVIWSFLPTYASSRMIDQVYGHLTPKFRAEQMGRIKFDIGTGGAGENGDQPASKTA